MRRYWALFLIFVAMICAISCNNDIIVQTGTLVVVIDSSSSRGIQAISMETASYDVTVKNSSGEIVFSSSSRMDTSYSVSVPVGTYTVEVDALNKDKIVIGSGSATGMVSVGQDNLFNVVIREPEGNGSFSIAITANEGYDLSYSIQDAAGSTIQTGALVFSEGIYSSSVELDNGFYLFSIMRNDNDKILKTDSVRIIKGKTATYDAELLILSDGSITIINEILATPQISLALSSKSLKTDATLTVSATITGISNYSCYWIVDGVPQSEAGDYSDLVLSLDGLDAGTHTVGLFISNGSVIWAESSNFTIIPERPTEIEVGGEVELWFIGDVLIPWDFRVNVAVGRSGYQFRPSATHGIAYLSADGEKITIESVSDENYFAYLDYKYDEVKQRTVVYIILDKFIEDPGFIEVCFPEYELRDDDAMGVWFDADTTVLNPNATTANYRWKGLVTVINDTESRIIKVEPDTYRQNGTSNSSDYFMLSLNRDPFVVEAGETIQSTWEVLLFSANITADLTDMVVNEEFTSKAKSIYLYCGNTLLGSWTKPDYFNHWGDYQTRGVLESDLGNNLSVRAVINLKDGISEDVFPYEIIPSVSELTVEEGCSYTIKFTTVLKDYVVGDRGPAGGFIFYDCDADNGTGNDDGLISSECGWRYLEAAPADLRIVDEIMTVDPDAQGYSSGENYFVSGYYRISTDNLFVNGTVTFDAEDCTDTAVGAGEINTSLLVAAMGDTTFSGKTGETTTSQYAAKLCLDLEYNGFDDWFLPSKDELNLIYTNKDVMAGFCDFFYWSSSEGVRDSGDAASIWVQKFSDGRQADYDRDNTLCIRPVRRF